jgi:lactoylglutathione lyase
MVEAAERPKFQWHHTMLRVKDPKVSIPFYETHFGFTLLHKMDFNDLKFSVYFIAILTPGEKEKWTHTPGSAEAHDALWTYKRVTIELCHNHGSENDENFKVNSGNVEPHRGFGHIAVFAKDVYATSADLEAKGCVFQKRPDEGNMKGLAFVKDPDGYWVELIKRADDAAITNMPFTLAQTMLRIKDHKKSIAFYSGLLGMNMQRKIELPQYKFSLYFMSHAGAGTGPSDVWDPVLELTHNHGTEDQADFKYHNGNSQDDGALQGFGHTAFLVDDLDSACAWLET